MARSVSVKIPTASVIEMIEAKLAELNKAEADYPDLLIAYNEAMIKFTENLVDFAFDNKNSIASPDNYDWALDKISITNDWRGSISIGIGKKLADQLGELPKKPDEFSSYANKQKKADLEKTLRLLKMTDQPTITSSTYNSVLDLL